MPESDHAGSPGRGEGDVAELATTRGWTVAVAESLTGGLLSARLAQLPQASDWFVGAVVAYASAVKHEVLGVPDVPVVSAAAARALADGVATLLGADVAVALTGVGGPGSQDGVPAGTVWMAVRHPGGTDARQFCFGGDPTAVVRQSCDAAMRWLAETLRRPST